MPRYSDVNEELAAIESFEEEAGRLAHDGVIDDASEAAIRAHYGVRRAQIQKALAEGGKGISRSAAASSQTVPIIAWIGILLVIGAAITVATDVWRDASSWQKVAILLVPAIVAYVISHQLDRRERTKRVGWVVLAGANALLVSALVVAASEYEWGIDRFNGNDVGLGVALFAVALCVLWIIRLDSDFYRLLGIVALTFALSFGVNLAWAERETAINERANVAYEQFNKEYEKFLEENPDALAPDQQKAIDAIEAERTAMWKSKSISLTAVFAVAGALIVAFGSWLERARNAKDARMYHLGGAALFIVAFMVLQNDIIPTAFDSLLPLILSLLAVWFGLHTERSAFVLAGLLMFLPTLILAFTGFGDNLGAIAGILAALGAIAIVIATRAERYRTALLDSISGRN